MVRYNITIKLVEGESSYIFLKTIFRKLKLNFDLKKSRDAVRIEGIPEESALRLIDMLEKYPSLFRYEYEVIRKEKPEILSENAKTGGNSNGSVGKIFLLIFFIFGILLFLHEVTSKRKPKQKVIFCANYYSARGFSVDICGQLCARYTCNINRYINLGWRIVSSSSKEIIVIPFDAWGGCKCVGTEYVIEKE